MFVGVGELNLVDFAVAASKESIILLRKARPLKDLLLASLLIGWTVLFLYRPCQVSNVWYAISIKGVSDRFSGLFSRFR